MASYSAKLTVDGQEYPVVLCTYSFTQAIGARGRVNERVRHGLLELVLDVPAGDQLLLWAATPHYPLDGHVSFYQASDFMARETVSFTAGECVSYQEIFEAGADIIGSYRCSLFIAAPQLVLTAGGASLSAAASPTGGLTTAGLVAGAKRAYAAAQQVRTTVAQATQTVATLKSDAQEVAQLPADGLSGAQQALAAGSQVAGVGAVAQEAQQLLTSEKAGKDLSALATPPAQDPAIKNFIPEL